LVWPFLQKLAKQDLCLLLKRKNICIWVKSAFCPQARRFWHVLGGRRPTGSPLIQWGPS
jgi:hypothetical protein